MRTQEHIAFVIISTILITLIWHYPAQGGMTDEQYYSSYVDKFIENCATKEKNFSGSCSITIQQYGALNCLKASFVSYFKEHLVNQMVYDDIGREDYKINHYINSKFFYVYRMAAGEIKDEYNARYPVEE